MYTCLDIRTLLMLILCLILFGQNTNYYFIYTCILISISNIVNVHYLLDNVVKTKSCSYHYHYYYPLANSFKFCNVPILELMVQQSEICHMYISSSTSYLSSYLTMVYLLNLSLSLPPPLSLSLSPLSNKFLLIFFRFI